MPDITTPPESLDVLGAIAEATMQILAGTGVTSVTVAGEAFLHITTPDRPDDVARPVPPDKVVPYKDDGDA